MCQGGDFTTGTGRGGESIYGGKFADEGFSIAHAGPGLLSMANSGPDSNGSQFFVTTVPCPHLDGRHVVFGELASGFQTLTALEANGSQSGAPDKVAIIVDCGELPLGRGRVSLEHRRLCASRAACGGRAQSTE